MASKKFPLLIFVFVLLVLIAGIATLAYHKAQMKQTYQAENSGSPASTTDTSTTQLDQDTQNIDSSMNSLNSDMQNVDTSLNDQPTNLQ
jgi:uncharacterized protein HemX